jgi:hypothetical protein
VVDPNGTTSPENSAEAAEANDSAFSLLALSVSNRVLPGEGGTFWKVGADSMDQAAGHV